MSDSSQGPGWWRASDGRWYPPESHPDAGLKLPPPPVASQPTPAGPTVVPTNPLVSTPKPWWRRWWVIAVGVLAVLVGLAVVASPADDDSSNTQPSGTEADAPESADAGTQPLADTASEDNTSEDDTSEAERSAPGSTAAVADETTDAEQETDTTTATTGPELPMVGSRDTPFAIDAPVQFTLDVLGDADRSVWTVMVDGPGADITQAVLSENQFNDPPDDGMVFYGVPVTLTLDAAGKEPLSPLSNVNFEFFGPSTLEIVGDVLDEGCGVTPDGFDPFKEVFAGGSISGTVCYSVSQADVDAGILLTIDEIEGDRLFFATVDDQGESAPDRAPVPIEPTTTEPSGDAAMGSRAAPVPLVTPVQFTLDVLGDADRSVWTVMVDGPGADITEAVLSENQFNDPPDDGMVFYGVPVTLTLDAAGKEPLSPLFNVNFEFFGPSTLEIVSDGLAEGCGVAPDGFDPFKEVFVGGSISGTVCYSVSQADVDAGVLLTIDEIEGGRIFFATG